MPVPVLYSFRRCPYAMRARLAIQSSGTQVELREIHLKHKPEHMLEASPKGTVPVLIFPDGSVIDESLDVARWALAEADPQGWLAPFEADREASDFLIARNDGPFKHHLDRYKYASRYEDVDASEHRAEGLKILEDLDARLADTGYLMAPAFTFVDAAIAPFVRQFRIPDKDWFDNLPLPALIKWVHDFMESDRFASVMEKYPRWEGGEGELFPAAL
ncbi:glutathione S-transferase [Ponticaulis koreensis]|uniref:glutathione S-transferase n=1 Tax=Ponticaulis koreensis TaxID=1123045 RepID=UPI0003B50339|nr:glutathione S-transferase [Ponticaulis koreensis]